ncbi:XDD4 family exosortase-dependent surface protein [Desulfovibrio sp. X2]|uniref:XDD4 family exosortase-dependent surface protein n=1 Tax=Desulfovibrio sp. X2 TaxID=941449 RepID=UPI00041724B3|nr:XDD4 family exosortase-dependent surface protein [Desulfovibrio sp. X2]
MNRIAKSLFILGMIVLAAASAVAAQASTLYYTGSSGAYSASALFSLTGNSLTVTLANTSTADTTSPSAVLTGLFFDVDGGYTLTPVSAALAGSTVYYGSLSDVGDGWGFKQSTLDLIADYNSFISASGALSGLGHSNFSSHHHKLGGADYGLLSAGFTNPGAKNKKGLSKQGPLIDDSVIFTFHASDGFSLDDLADSVAFQYGTSLCETRVTGYDPPTPTPEPCTMLLMGAGVLGTVVARRRARAVERRDS